MLSLSIADAAVAFSLALQENNITSPQHVNAAESRNNKDLRFIGCGFGLWVVGFGLLVCNDDAKVMFFHENAKKTTIADYFKPP